MNTWSFVDSVTGLFTGTVYTGSQLERNTPVGCSAIEGSIDPLSQRVDLVSLAARQAAIDAANAPEEPVVVEGTPEEVQAALDRQLAARARRLATALALPVVVVAYQPPAPPDDAQQTWSWDGRAKRWVSTPTLAALKAAKWEEVKRARATAEAAGFTWDGSTFDSNPASQSRLQGAAFDALVAGEAFTITWTLADNTNRILGYADMLAVGVANAAHIQAARLRSRTLRAQLDAATTEAEVSSTVWDANGTQL